MPPPSNVTAASAASTVRAETAEDDATEAVFPDWVRKEKSFIAPDFWTPEGFTRPRLANGTPLSRAAVEKLGTALATGQYSPDRGAFETTSLAAIGWELFESWLSHGAPAKGKWAFLALGGLGDDDTVRRLGPLLRAWPDEGLSQRAISGVGVLEGIGTSRALMLLYRLSQSSRSKALRDAARESFSVVARRREIPQKERADITVPDLGLEDDGKTLDYGTRSFRVGFDEHLVPFVLPDGARSGLPDLPKPTPSDDAAAAKNARATWKAIKDGAPLSAGRELLRLELAMSNERTWRAEAFLFFLVEHPFLFHAVKRLVWGVFDASRELVTAFRVTEHRALVDVHDEAVLLPNDAAIAIMHPVRLQSSVLDAWRGVFHQQGLAQPFPQLDRRVLPASSGRPDEAAKTISGDADNKSLRALLSRGWRAPPVDSGVKIRQFSKQCGGGEALLQLDPGIDDAPTGGTTPRQSLRLLFTGAGIPAAALNDVLLDIETLKSLPLSST